MNKEEQYEKLGKPIPKENIKAEFSPDERMLLRKILEAERKKKGIVTQAQADLHQEALLAEKK